MQRIGMAALAATLLLGASSGAAMAQELVPWGRAGGWDVMVDRTTGGGCLIMSDFEDGSHVRIGLDPSNENGYVLALNHAWGDIQTGVVYQIAFEIDREGYSGEATGLYIGGMPGVDIQFDSLEFFEDIVRGRTMSLYHDGEEVMAISLEGTYAGLEEVVRCQEEVTGL